MSCWIVCPTHLDVLVTGLIEHGIISPRVHRGMRLALVTENVDSYTSRYAHIKDAVREGAAFYKEQKGVNYTPRRVTPVALLKAIHCYSYQACEHDAWKACKVNKLLGRLADKLRDAGVPEDGPDYNKAPWGFDSDNVGAFLVPTSFKTEVQTHGCDGWTGNQLRFATADEAQGYVKDLERRWTLVSNTRVVPVDEPVNYVWHDGKLLSLDHAKLVKAQ